MGRGRLGRWPILYDLDIDPSESYNLIDNHPEVGQRLLFRMAAWEEDLEQNLRGWITK